MKKGGSGTTIGKEVVTVVTVVTPTPARREFEEGKLAARKRWVAMNEAGNARIGEYHHGAKLTDAQVEAIRDQYEAYPRGHKLHLGYKRLAQIWGVSVSSIRMIVTYERRNHWAASWRKV